MDRTAEREIKHAQVAELLGRHGLDGVLLTRRCNFAWYTGGARNYVSTGDDVGNSTLLVTRDGAAVLTSNIEAPRLRDEDLAGTPIEVFGPQYWDAAARAAAVEKLTAKRRLAADVPVAGAQAAPLPAEFNRLRWKLTAGEVERYHALCDDVVAAVESVCRGAFIGQTENELAGVTAFELRKRGCLPWVLLVAADDRVGKYRHPLPVDRLANRYFMIAVGAERGGLIAACTRLASFGKVPGELAQRHHAVVRVDAALASATRPGATLGEIFAEAQAAYATVGFEDAWMFHHQGGSIGYLPREVKAAPGDATVALDCQAFAWNPSIEGTKSEDTILCLESGATPLASPTQWPMIEAEWRGFSMARPDILVL
jgi:Xaa-Pro aminopeptidase